MADKEYIRLARPRMRSGFLASNTTRSSLWLGRDHLLAVETNGYKESYKRFYFRDIQAISMHKTKMYLIGNAVFIPLVLLFLILGVFVGVDDGKIVLFGLGLLLALPLIVVWFRGPTCLVRIRTAVQEEEIPGLGHIRKANAVLQRIRPLIAEAQGELKREELPARLQELTTLNQPRLVVDDPSLPPRMVS